jgi:flavin reductase (DIM6/NTAB) family NADH-FMN oxidoreductase RutF
MTKISWKPGTMLFPLPPVMVTCGTMKKPNVLTIAWTGIVNSEPPLTYISVRPSRFSHGIISKNKEFVINLVNLPLSKACDYCGIKSGAKTDKIKDMNLELEACSVVKTPQLKASPITLECKVLDSEKFDTHEMFLAEIVNVNIDDKYLEEDGRLAVEKMGLIAFAHGRYYTLGRDLGAFGFSVDKSKENKTKPRKSQFMQLLKIEEKFKEGTLRIKEKKPSLQKALSERKSRAPHKGKALKPKGRGFLGGNHRKNTRRQTKSPTADKK